MGEGVPVSASPPRLTIGGVSGDERRSVPPRLQSRAPGPGTEPGTDELRRPGLCSLPAPIVRAVHGVLDGGARAPHRRHRRLQQRLQQLPSPPARADRRGRARGDGGGRAPLAFPTISLGEVFLEPDQHALPEPHVHGCRGDDPRAAHGRGGAGGRLRQDGARPAHGGGVGGRPRRAARGGPHDGIAPPGRAARRVHGLPAILGALPCRRPDARGGRRGRRAPGHDRRHLCGHGHGEHHGLCGGGPGHGPARQRRHPGRARRPAARRRGNGRGRRRARPARSHAVTDSDPGRRRERAAGDPRDRRFHECSHPPDGHRRPRGGGDLLAGPEPR